MEGRKNKINIEKKERRTGCVLNPPTAPPPFKAAPTNLKRGSSHHRVGRRSPSKVHMFTRAACPSIILFANGPPAFLKPREEAYVERDPTIFDCKPAQQFIGHPAPDGGLITCLRCYKQWRWKDRRSILSKTVCSGPPFRPKYRLKRKTHPRNVQTRSDDSAVALPMSLLLRKRALDEACAERSLRNVFLLL